MLGWTAPIVSDKPWSVTVGGGGVNFYFYRLGTATNVFSMEDIDNWWSRSIQEGCISQNIIYLYFKNLSSRTSKNHCFPLRRDYLFTFMLCHHLLKQAPETEKSTVVMIYALCVANLGASWLDLFYHELQCLVAAWTLEVLCIYVLQSQIGLVRYHYCHIISWLFWQRVAVWVILSLLASWLCHWYESL